MKEFLKVFCVLLFAAISYWTTAVVGDCSPGQFECMNKRCISEDLTNNTVNDCGDNTDEGAPPNSVNCQVDPVTLKDKFKCFSGECINMRDVLDGSPDCVDKSDEHKFLGSRCFVFPGQCCPCNASIPGSYCRLRPPPYTDGLIEGVCRCPSGRRNNTLGTECIIRRIGDECDLHSDCFDAMPFTACLSNKCACAPGRYLVVNRTADESINCILRKIGDNCSQVDDCSMAVNDSTCSNNRCLCNHGYKATKDLTKCRIPQIDSLECSSDSECRLQFANTTCNHQGVCVCLPAFYPNEASDVCLRYLLDSPCTASTACQASINNTQCLGRKCACANGFYSANQHLCLPRVIGMDGCLTDADCSAVGNSRCSANRTCACLPGHIAGPGGATCSLRRIGDRCQTMDDCSAAVNRSVCSGSKCRCEDGFKEAGDNRLCVLRQVGDECYRDAECRRAMANSYCLVEEQRCDCVPGYEPNELGSGCVRAQVDGIGCRNSSWCQGLVKNSICSSNGRCVCADGFYPNVDGTGCALLKVGVLPCNSDDRCSKAMNSTMCADDLCVCQPGFYANIASNHCVNTSVGKTTCHDGGGGDGERTCRLAIYKSECIGGRCQCAPGYKVLGGRSCVATQLGQACQVDEHCTAFIDHSACVNQTCVCAPGYNSTDGITCVPLRDLHGVCMVPSFCPGWCWVLIGIFIGTFLASVILGGILCKKKLQKKHLKSKRVSPIGMEYGMDHRWQLEWSNRPPAHIPVMYKSPSMRAPDEIYGDLLNFDFNAMIFDRPDAKSKKSLPESHA